MADFDLSSFDFSFDPSFKKLMGEEPTEMDDVMGADPGVFLPNTEGRTEFLPPDVENMPQIPNSMDTHSEEYAQRPAAERTRELFAYMNPHRQVLLGVLRAAQEPKSNDEIQQEVDDLRTHKFSVYSPANICTMLEQAGAMEKITEDGAPYGDFEPEAKIVVIDGEEFWEPTEPPMVYWRITEAGQAALDANDPLDRITRQLERESEFLPIYKRVLTFTSREGGATMADLSAAVDEDPAIAVPRRFFVQHFVEAFERCECVAWQGRAWVTTEFGQQVFDEKLADVIDDYVIPAERTVLPGTEGLMAAETQGVNW